MTNYGVAVRPHTTLRRLLVHPTDKVELAEQGELVSQTPGKNCGVEYTGETGRLLKTRLDEHRKDVDNTNNETYTRSGKRLMSNFNKSALTDHATTENHIVDEFFIIDKTVKQKNPAHKGSLLYQKDKDTNEQTRGQL